MSRRERAGAYGLAVARRPGDERRRIRRLNVLAAIAIPACLAAGAFELARARAGNQLSWVYAFEWPVIATYATYMWRRLVHEQARGHEVRTGPPGEPEPLQPAAGETGPAPDTQLAAWQEYLTRLHAEQPPGGPPGGA